MARPRILVVDDEAAQREVVLYNLEAAGFEVCLLIMAKMLF